MHRTSFNTFVDILVGTVYCDNFELFKPH